MKKTDTKLLPYEKSLYICLEILQLNTMNKYEQQKILEVVLYILLKTGGIDYYHLFKILYFAEREHLAKWGDRITADDFFALQYGPVPTRLYNAIKKQNAPDANLDKLLWEVVEFAGDDAPNVLLPKRSPNPDYLSESEKMALEKSIDENSKKLFRELKSKSHDVAWENAVKRSPGRISPIDMARAEGTSDDMLEYIQEQIALSAALA
ncbi:MAG: SocA family protein [Prevotellaceae bacterium]|nr:SocA family protein [Prevotellaceae bacterium]